MNDNKKKLKILDYAIERINEYSDFDDNDRAIEVVSRIDDCTMCNLMDECCDMCPFNYVPGSRFGCRPFGWSKFIVKIHQDSLIKSTKKWCRENKLKYTIGIMK